MDVPWINGPDAPPDEYYMAKHIEKLEAELEWFRSLKLRRDGVPTIGGEAANKVHLLWEERDTYKRELEDVRIRLTYHRERVYSRDELESMLLLCDAEDVAGPFKEDVMSYEQARKELAESEGLRRALIHSRGEVVGERDTWKLRVDEAAAVAERLERELAEALAMLEKDDE